MLGRVWYSPRRLYCELRDHRVFITLNDLCLSTDDAARRVALSRAASAFGHERGWNVRWHEEKVLGTTGFDYSGPRRSHEGARATGRQHVHGPLFIDLPELELRVAEDKPPDSSCSPWIDGATLAHIRPVRIGGSRFTC